MLFASVYKVCQLALQLLALSDELVSAIDLRLSLVLGFLLNDFTPLLIRHTQAFINRH